MTASFDLAVMLLKGMGLGLSIAAPVGPIGILCMRRTLEGGVLAGVAGGLGTALADGVYAAVAAFGVAGVAALLQEHAILLNGGGALVLLWLAVKTLRSAPASGDGASAGGRRGVLGLCAATFALTIANPPTIALFAALFAGLGLGAGADAATALALVAGVFCGSMLWWVILSTGVSLMRHRLSPPVLLWINRGAGMVLLGFAAAMLMAVAAALP
ncbi:LysE family translocator [Novispirillum itersonii]|uniref:LysE family translocator n=1 Tax=Novispirillum itersonii TaxID=189 RepID=UPI000378AFB6|nr:LysE family transporter [Novispirillum itersonii]